MSRSRVDPRDVVLLGPRDADEAASLGSLLPDDLGLAWWDADAVTPGGLDLRALATLLRPLATDPRLVGFSLGCYNPEKDPDGASGDLLAVLLAGTLGGAA